MTRVRTLSRCADQILFYLLQIWKNPLELHISKSTIHHDGLDFSGRFSYFDRNQDENQKQNQAKTLFIFSDSIQSLSKTAAAPIPEPIHIDTTYNKRKDSTITTWIPQHNTCTVLTTSFANLVEQTNHTIGTSGKVKDENSSRKSFSALRALRQELDVKDDKKHQQTSFGLQSDRS
jgi:hypothetical protein